MEFPSFDALQQRYDQHQAAEFGGTPGRGEAALAHALTAIGWRAAGVDAIGEVAAYGWEILGGCVTGHRDPAVAARDLADLMRQYAPRHSGFLAPVEEFVPAATEVLRRYTRSEEHAGVVPPPT